MKPHIDFVECVKDSPMFRAHLEQAEADIESLEGKLEKVTKLCHGMVDAGRIFGSANSAYIAGLQEFIAYFRGDDAVVVSIKRLVQTMSELQNFHAIFVDQAYKSVCTNLRKFISSDVRPVKELQKEFKKSSDDLDAALMKHIQAPKARPAECEEASNMLIAAKSRFTHTSLDYTYQLNVLNLKKRHSTLGSLTGYMQAQSAYFHSGHAIFADLDSSLKNLTLLVEELRRQTTVETKQMENRHNLVQGQKLMPEGSNAEGYLFKRTSKGFKSWVRRWFCIQNNQLVYTKQLSDGFTVMEDDLRLCSVKAASADVDRRFCFEVRSPTRTHVLQATSEDECSRWVTALHAGVAAAYRDSAPSALPLSASSPTLASGQGHQAFAGGGAARDDANAGRQAASLNGQWLDAESYSGSGEGAAKLLTSGIMSSKSSSSLRTANQAQLILSVPGNSYCCDCRSRDPCWASSNLGITLCIECSGIHRSLGVHISKVRSLTLDSWEPEMLKVMAEIGNDTFNAIYEANLPKGTVRAEHTSDRARRETWIKNKYVKKSFVKHLLADLPSAAGAATASIAQAGQEEKTRSLKWSVQIRNRKTLPRKPSELPSSPAVIDEPGARRREPPEDVMLFGARVNDADACRPSIDSDSESDDDASSPARAAAAETDAESHTSLEEVEQLDANMLLYRAAEARNIPVMMEALANGANVNWQCPRASMKTPLIRAVESGSLAACEFLLLNGARVDVADERGRPPLHHATMTGHTAQVCQLLKRGANQRHRDAEGVDALTLAVKAEQADIVTLLRVADLRQQMTDADPGIQSDELFNDVFRDFTNMASSDPDKLKRDVTRVPE